MIARRPAYHVAAAALLCAAVWHGAVRAEEKRASPPPAVNVVRVEERDFTPSFSFTGRIEAVDSVDLRARVEGFLEQRRFVEGAEVEKGAPLFTIEKAPYETAVAEAKASLARAEAELKLAELEKDRYMTLAKQQAAAQQQADVATAKAAQATAAVQGARATLERAELDLGYTDINSPFAGKVGIAVYSVGSFVGPSSGALTTVVSQDPMYVTFPVSQRVLLEVRKRNERSGFRVRDVGAKVRLADGSIYGHDAKIDFVDVKMDQGTDTVRVRATLPNPERSLIDNQLVTVIAASTAPEKVMVVPLPAVLVDQAGRYVLVVDDQSKVQPARIEIRAGRNGLAIIDKGLKIGDRVITEGIQRVRPGIEVSATEVPMPAPAERDVPPPAPAGGDAPKPASAGG